MDLKGISLPLCLCKERQMRPLVIQCFLDSICCEHEVAVPDAAGKGIGRVLMLLEAEGRSMD